MTWELLLSPIASGVVLALIVWGFKLPHLLRDNTEAIKKLTDKVDVIIKDIEHAQVEIQISHRRHDVVQQVLSDVIGEAIDTKKIADDYKFYPQIKIKRNSKRES